MYKVFFNEKLIVITHLHNITLFKTRPVFVEGFLRNDLEKLFERFFGGSSCEIVLVHTDPQSFFLFFQSLFVFVKAAGGVVLRNGKLLFIFKNEKWDLPKGKADAGETIENTAIREVEEECGINDLAIVKNIFSTYHIYKSPYTELLGEYIFKETVWFEMKYSGSGLGVPQSDEGITEVRWLDRDELHLVEENTHENIKQIISLYRA
ncbi:MAG: NUDIX domain-containing protein [Bacteroidales bacterium]|jgi:8-oxo-dGTP pyrophosphatase MutT (NUDIX family)|nr:NUDIX domain-containing protein [Bacteroidales bacterium]